MVQNPPNKIVIGTPSDPELLQAIGKLAIAHGNMEMVLIYCLKTLEGLTIEKNTSKVIESHIKKYRDHRERESSARNQIKKLCKSEISENKHKGIKVKIDELMEKSEKLSEERNDYLHCVWGKRIGSDKWEISPDEANWYWPT